MDNAYEQIVASLQSLQQQVEDLRSIQVNQRPRTSFMKEPKICMPEKFDGDRTKFRGFLQQVKLYICMQLDRYPNDASKVGFIGTLLYGQALSWFTPILEKDMAVRHDYEGFLRELIATFGDADTSRVVETKL
ncbi:hypothetical protein KP509_21G056900 [Ceratopteris richardii]|uniref:DUF4939 domain-containing protein n=1 Tax=Ceratopteris richardii TaxID=49495 RepID=A0A8T2SD60_CERRI|nr:hypothetical protein KP509_21G056900 [Ceratopteris richardii]